MNAGPAGAAGGVADCLAGLGCDAVDHAVDLLREPREVLASAGLPVLRVLLQQALVGVAIHVDAQRGRVLLVDQIGPSRAAPWRGPGTCSGPYHDQPERAFFFAQRFQRVAVVVEQLVPVAREQRGPRELCWDQARLVWLYGGRERSSAILRNSR
jgi:hypothetical protein